MNPDSFDPFDPERSFGFVTLQIVGALRTQRSNSQPSAPQYGAADWQWKCCCWGITRLSGSICWPKHCSSAKQSSSKQPLTSYRLMKEADGPSHVPRAYFPSPRFPERKMHKPRQGQHEVGVLPLSQTYSQEQTWHQKPIWGPFPTETPLRERAQMERLAACQRKKALGAAPHIH